MPVQKLVVLVTNAEGEQSIQIRDRLTKLLAPALEADKLGQWKGYGKATLDGPTLYDTTEFVVKEYIIAEGVLYHLAARTDLDGMFETKKVVENGEGPDFGPTEKSIEIYYDAVDVTEEALDFRNAAMDLIETALANAGAGEWEGAEIGVNFETGKPEVNFGFVVSDFDAAETIVRNVVANTPYEKIREIRRSER